MKTRIITALVLIPLLVAVLLSNIYIVSAAVTVVSVMGLYEFFKATGLKEHRCLCAVGFAATVAICLRTYIPLPFYMPLFYIGLIAVFCIMLKCHKTVSVSEAGLLIFSLVYIPFLLSTLIDISGLQYGKRLLWIVFIGAFATDTFAYFTGVFLGKHKLCPEISPKKTIEGSIGGALGCIVFMLLYGLLLEKSFGMSINYIKLAVLGVIMSLTVFLACFWVWVTAFCTIRHIRKKLPIAVTPPSTLPSSTGRLHQPATRHTPWVSIPPASTQTAT